MTGKGFRPEKLIADKVALDKKEVARRQLCAAVRMFFFSWDIVSQHTLVAAAYDVLRDLARQEGREDSILDSRLVPKSDRKRFASNLRIPQNYFKHANHDPEKHLNFPLHMTHFFLEDAIRLYVMLTSKAPHEMRVFLVWFQLQYPELLCIPSIEEELAKLRNDCKDAESFKKIARALLSSGFSSETTPPVQSG